MKNKFLMLKITFALVILTLITFVASCDLVTEEQRCVEAGGEWRQFSDACADLCEYRRGEVDMCAQVLTMSCDCGEGMCWTGYVCEPI